MVNPLMVLMGAGLATGLVSIAVLGWWSARRRRARELQLEQEYLDAYRRLHVRTGARLDQARFSYRPATRELKLDALAADYHGLPAASAGRDGCVCLRGWHEVPAAAGVAGWIDEALAEGLCTRQPIECAYRARAPGLGDRHFVLHAVPLHTADVMVGAVAQTGGPKKPPTPVAGRRDMLRSWMPGPRSVGLDPSAAP